MALIDNIAGYWKLDETSGNAADSTAGAKTLTNTNSVTYTPGLINNGADFGAANTTKKLASASNITTSVNFSMSGWVKLNTEIGAGTTVFLEHGDNVRGVNHIMGYEYNAGARRVMFDYHKNGGTDTQTYYTFTLGTSNWCHLVYTYDGTNMRMYVNGTLQGTVAASGTGTILYDALTVGASQRFGSTYASAKIDEVGVWSRTITAAEVTELYKAGNGLSYPFSIVTNAVTSISTTTATGNGEILSDGGATITERGFVWATIPTPTTSNSKVTVAGTLGVYSATLSTLAANTLYYVRSFFTNANGTTYGNEVTFTTLNINQYELQYPLTVNTGDTYVGQINVTGSVGTITVKLGTTGTSTVITAGAGATTFTGTYSGLSGLIITRSATFNGTVDNVYYAKCPLGTTINWAMNTVSITTAIPASVFFKRVEDQLFNNFRFYRYLDLLFKDLDGYVTVTIREEREDNTTEKTKTFSVGNLATGTVSPFQKKRISFLCKDQAIIIGLSNANLGETFSIAQFLLLGDKKPRRNISPAKIISVA